jgi:hypothetical protein
LLWRISNAEYFSVKVGYVLHKNLYLSVLPKGIIQGDTKKRVLLKNPTKIKEIQPKIILTEIEPLQLAF